MNLYDEEQLKKELRAAFETKKAPDVKANIQQIYYQRQEEKRVALKRKRKFLFLLPTLGIGCASIIAATLIWQPFSTTGTSNSSSLPPYKDSPFLEERFANTLRYETVSALHLMDQLQTITTPQAAIKKQGEESEEGVLTNQEIAVRMHHYFLLSEPFAQENSPFKTEKIESEHGQNYQKKEKITNNLTNESYVLFYNLEEEGDEFSWSGRIKKDMIYGFEGARKKDHDKERKQGIKDELSVRIYLKDDQSSFVEATKEIDRDEVEYTYEIFTNGKLVSSIELTSENEKNSKQTSIEIFDSALQLDENYGFEYETANRISVECEMNDEEYEATIEIRRENSVPTYIYSFPDGEKIKI